MMRFRNTLTTLAAAVAVAALPTLWLSCAKPGAGARSGSVIAVTVNSVPSKVKVAFAGETIGHTPVQHTVGSFDELINSFSIMDDKYTSTVEERITVMSDHQVEVNLVLDSKFSKMAKALGLSKIIVFDYGEGITFDSNKSELKPDFRPLLEKQAEMLKKFFAGVDVYICGHTDSQGGKAHNQELSLERAMSVYSQLLELGVPKEVMKPQGFGYDYPMSDNKTPEGRARNRRIEVILGR